MYLISETQSSRTAGEMLHSSSRLVVPLRAQRSRWSCNRNSVKPLNRRRFASFTDLKKYPQPGENIYGFTLKRKKHIPELQLTALHLEHDKTGAEYLHVARDDKNNVFSIAFKTNPPDDSGVPHILEHTTLCGSERYAGALYHVGNAD